MAEASKIEWTDATWNPITGCSVVSPGCTNCYAMKLAGGRLAHHPSRAGLTQPSKAGPVWTGEVRLNESWIDQPLRWRRPRMIFVCAHGDLFHEDVPYEWVDKVFAVMAMASKHNFQVLTKRPERMEAYIKSRRGAYGRMKWSTEAGVDMTCTRDCADPLPNVWLGVSVEDQARADERIPILLDTPAAVRFLSAEPLLGPVDLTRLELVPDSLDTDGELRRAGIRVDALRNKHYESGVTRGLGALDWVIVGGESGPGARPMHPDWVRSIRDQCIAAGVPLFFKQWGAWGPTDVLPKISTIPSAHGVLSRDGTWRFDSDIADPPDHCFMHRVGKKRAGRQLDGRSWDEMPPTIGG